MIKRNITLPLLLLFVISLNIYFRSFPIYFPQLKIQAKKMVDASIQQSVMQEVYKKFPQFYYSAKDAIVKDRVSEYKKQNRKVIKKQIRDLYLKMKDRYQDDHGQTYLFELDCWHWGRYVENVLRLGRPGDEVIYRRQWDVFMLAPIGAFLPLEHFLFYISALLYLPFSIFKTIPLFTFLFYLPLFFSAIFISVLYLFSFRHGGHIGGIVSCLLIGLAPIFLYRSCAGWFDMDILNLLFPLLIIWTYTSSVTIPAFRPRIARIGLSSLWVALFCFTWPHWWFIFSIVIIYEVASMGYLALEHIAFKRNRFELLKVHIFSLSLFVSLSFFWIVLLMGRHPFEMLYMRLEQALLLSKPLMSSIWPNVYSTVGEMKRTTILEVMSSVGTREIAIFSFVSMIALLLRSLFSQAYSDSKRASIMLLNIWFLPMLFASLESIRFVVFLLIPLAISLGWALNDVYEHFRKRKNIWMAGLVIVVTIFLSVTVISKGNSAASNAYPLMDDTWYKVLNLINEKAPKEMIINSWWDFGDWFKVVAKRRVIFDGQSQDTPQAYWMGKVLLSDDENKAIGILRMLNNGGNRAFEIINEYLDNQLLSVLLLESVIGSNPEKAQAVLLKFLPESVAQDVMRILFYTPPPAGFVVDHTMAYKIPAISYLGNWDFSKVYIAQNFDKVEKNQIVEHLKNLGGDNNLIQRFYQEAFLISNKNLNDWLSQRLQFYSPLVNGREKNGLIYFDTGFIYNIKDKAIQSNSGQIPRSVFIEAGNNFVETLCANPNVPFSVLVFETKDGYKSILLDRELARSLFVRLYFLGGRGLKHFVSFIDVEEGNNFIRFFSINW